MVNIPDVIEAEVLGGADSFKATPIAARTVNLDATMTRTEIQALIDAEQKYIASGGTLIFQFANGTYTLDGTLLFSGFFGGGNIGIYGEAVAEAQTTAQAVHLDFSTAADHGIQVGGNSVPVIDVFNLKITGATAGFVGSVIGYNNAGYMLCRGCYMTAAGFNGVGYYASALGFHSVRNMFVTRHSRGIYCTDAKVSMSACDDTGTMPTTGTLTERGIVNQTGGVLDGSSVDNQATQGGRIFT
jgi:hypothetical protein